MASCGMATPRSAARVSAGSSGTAPRNGTPQAAAICCAAPLPVQNTCRYTVSQGKVMS